MCCCKLVVNMAELEKLKKIRGGHRAQVTKLITEAYVVDQLTMDQNKILQSRIDERVDVLEKFDSDVCEKMEETADFDAEIKDSKEYMDQLIEAITKLELNIAHINKKALEDNMPKDIKTDTKTSVIESQQVKNLEN